MGRNNADFQGSALYHGTSHPFAIGDVVEPRAIGNGSPKAWATPDLMTAVKFAHFKGGARNMHIFQVEPVDPNEELGVVGEHKAITSAKGYKVVKKIEDY